MIRPAFDSDVKQLFQWRNLQEAIELSSSQKIVTWDEHVSWFNDTLQGNDTLVFIIEPSAGTVRFNKIENDAFISITLLKEFRGKGLGIHTINEAIIEMRKQWDVKRVNALILEDNVRSVRVFSKCGFVQDRSVDCPEGHIRMTRI